MNDVSAMFQKPITSLKTYSSCFLFWLLLWPGLGASAGLTAPQGDAPTSFIYEGAAAEALQRGDGKLVEAFRQRKVEIKARKNSSDSRYPTAYAEAMIRAAGPDDLELVKMLLERGADLKLKDKAGRDALQHARDLERKEIEMLLRSAAAK